MKTPLILFTFSALALLVGIAVPSWSDVLLLAVPSLIASLWLLWRAWQANRQAQKAPTVPRRPTSIRRPKSERQKWVIVDGSNVMYWKGGTPSLKPLRDVLALLERRGFTAGVMFDANAGHLLSDKYQHDHVFSQQLGLPEDRIMVVPKGTPADPYILVAAIEYGAVIVTNDRFRDWADEYPEVSDKGFLITGGYRDGKLVTSLG